MKRAIEFDLPVSVFLLWLLGGSLAEPIAAQEQAYHASFKGRTRIPDDFYLIGMGSSTYVKFGPDGMRITLPKGEPGSRPGIGVQTRFGVRGDFEMTVSYEILQEPEPQDAGVQTRFTMGVNMERAKPWLHQVTITRRVWGARGTEYVSNMTLHDFGDPSKRPVVRHPFPTKVKAGRLRLVRVGADVSYYASDGIAGPFEHLDTIPFVNEDVRQVSVVGSTGGEKAALDVRITDLWIRGTLIRDLPPEKKAPENGAEEKIPTKDYAQTYVQPFQGTAIDAPGWSLLGPEADNCVRFEPAGLRLTLPAGWAGERPSTGVKSGFPVKGDFEITMNFDLLKEPAQADIGPQASRVSLEVIKDTPVANTPNCELATINRGIDANLGKVFVTYLRQLNQPVLAHVFPTTASSARLRLIRSGGELFFLTSEGAGAGFQLRQKYRFGTEDLAGLQISVSTGGERASLDARVTDLVVRADAIPGAPASAVQVGAERRDSARTWLLPVLIAGAATLAVLAALGLWGFLHMRRARVDKVSRQSAAANVSFACPQCERHIKVRAELAGKKVKCAQCGTTALVPSAVG